MLAACSSSPTSGGGSEIFIPIVAINADFDSNFGPGIYLAKGYSSVGSLPPINPTWKNTNVAGKDCLMINLYSKFQYGNSSVEVQWNLNDMIDMSREDFVIYFDLYIPSSSIGHLQGFQFAFYDSGSSYTPIYSYFLNVAADQWTNFAIPITKENISYDGFTSDKKPNPVYWTALDKVRFQFVTSTNQDVTNNILFYVDNLVVSNIQKTN